MDDYVDNPNLELIINKDKWSIIILNNDSEHKWYMTNTFSKTLYINYVNVDQAKLATWQMHHEEYKECYYG